MKYAITQVSFTTLTTKKLDYSFYSLLLHARLILHANIPKYKPNMSPHFRKPSSFNALVISLSDVNLSGNPAFNAFDGLRVNPLCVYSFAI